MNIENVINKYNYSKDFSEFLREVYIELVKEYGNEEIIYEALLNTPIINVNNVYDYLLENHYLDDNDLGIVDAGDLKRSSGVCSTEPVLDYNLDTNEYIIKEIKKVVLVRNFDINSDEDKGLLIHELCHLAKNYYNEYVINGDILISRNGLIEEVYKLSYDGNKVKKTLVSELGTGLEEGLNYLTEEIIAKRIVSSNYKATGCGISTQIAKNLLEDFDINEILVNAQIYHDKEELYNKLGMEKFIELESFVDQIYKLELIMFSQIFEPEKMKETEQELLSMIEKYRELRQNMIDGLKL